HEPVVGPQATHRRNLLGVLAPRVGRVAVDHQERGPVGADRDLLAGLGSLLDVAPVHLHAGHVALLSSWHKATAPPRTTNARTPRRSCARGGPTTRRAQGMRGARRVPPSR